MLSNQLLYFMYGSKPAYRHEAKFSILSALRNRANPNSFSITVMTDQPEIFVGWPVDILPVSKDTLDIWLGRHGYIHRRKACAIRAGLELADKSIFVDTDTIFTGDPTLLFQRVTDSQYLMDQLEFSWKKASKRPEYQGLVAQFQAENTIPPNSLKLFNSGICGMTSKNTSHMDEAISRIDSWAHHHTRLHTVEQVAISFVLAGRKVAQAYDHVNHYYSVKDYYHAMLKLFFKEHGEEFHSELPNHSALVPNRLPTLSLIERIDKMWALRSCNEDLKKVGKYYFLGKKVHTSNYLNACREIWWGKALKTLADLNIQQKTKAGSHVWDQDAEFLRFAKTRTVDLKGF